MIYLLNTPILTAYGDFRFSGPLAPAAARERLTPGFVSAIGHAASAAFLSATLGLEVPTNRIAVAMSQCTCWAAASFASLPRYRSLRAGRHGAAQLVFERICRS